MFLSQLSEESLNFLALVSSMPGLGHVLEICPGQTVVAVVTKEASNCHAVAKLNSRFEVDRGLVD